MWPQEEHRTWVLILLDPIIWKFSTRKANHQVVFKVLFDSDSVTQNTLGAVISLSSYNCFPLPSGFCIKTLQVYKWISKVCYIHTVEYYSAIKGSTDTCYKIDES